MRFTTTASFDRDLKRLKAEHKREFVAVVRDKFVAACDACDAWAAAQEARQAFVWPKSLRVNELVNTHGVMEMTWSFASPDGRATFAFTRDDKGWVCVWRRVGDHDVFGKP